MCVTLPQWVAGILQIHFSFEKTDREIHLTKIIIANSHFLKQPRIFRLRLDTRTHHNFEISVCITVTTVLWLRHYNDFSRRHGAFSHRQLVGLIQDDIKKRPYLAFGMWLMDSPHRAPVMRRPFPCHKVFMESLWLGQTKLQGFETLLLWTPTIIKTVDYQDHRWPVDSPHKWPVTRKMFPFDDVIMYMLLPRTSIKHKQIKAKLNIYWQNL